MVLLIECVVGCILFMVIMVGAVLWKKVRLPGTEDMDKEYNSNWRKHVKNDFICFQLRGYPYFEVLFVSWV